MDQLYDGGRWTVTNTTPHGFSILFAANAVGLIGRKPVQRPLCVTRRTLTHAQRRSGHPRWRSARAPTRRPDNAETLATVIPPLFLIVTSLGLIAPNATALALSDFPDSAGRASALLGVLQFGTGALIAPLVGIGGSHDALPMALLVTALAAGAVACRVGSSASRAPLTGVEISAAGEPTQP